MNDVERLEERVRRLESRVRRAQAWSLACTVTLGVVVLGSMQASPSKELVVDRIVTRQLRVIDEEGATRATLGPDGQNPSEVSLDLRSKDRQKGSMARMRVGELAAEIEVGGDERRTTILLQNDDRSATLDLLSRADTKHEARVNVVELRASDAKGSLMLQQAHVFEEKNGWGFEGSPVLRLDPDEGYAHKVDRR